MRHIDPYTNKTHTIIYTYTYIKTDTYKQKQRQIDRTIIKHKDT